MSQVDIVMAVRRLLATTRDPFATREWIFRNIPAGYSQAIALGELARLTMSA